MADNTILLIIDDINNENMRVIDILNKYKICRRRFYKIVNENEPFITLTRHRGKNNYLLNTHDKKYNFFLEIQQLHDDKEKGVYKGPIAKPLCERYDISYKTYQKVYYEMLDFHNELKRQDARMTRRALIMLKYRKQSPRNTEEQLQLFQTVYDFDVLITKDTVVKAYCNLHFRPYFKLCIPEGTEYLKPMFKKYNIILWSLDKWIQYKKQNKKLYMNPLAT
jgi:hypothetical protein